ncbi:MAG: hypothetical protein KDB14_18950 [Planctomycetales bacterium]|nr:hypothetical protein [Planctomycetales bacterium]
MLDREEYVEQGFLYEMLQQRLPMNLPLQELLAQVGHELLATTKLPMAVSFLQSELVHSGRMCEAMSRLSHYFHPFATYVIREAEDDRGRIDFLMALRILEADAKYRAAEVSPQGMFLFQFETLCRNHLKYDPGLEAMAGDPIFDEHWRHWIRVVRRQAGMIELADMVYVRSELYDGPKDDSYRPLFGAKEGRIALANRRKDPLFFFAALQRQLGYPKVPRPQPPDRSMEMIPELLRRMERLETRMKMIEEEQRVGAADLSPYLRPEDRRKGS